MQFSLFGAEAADPQLTDLDGLLLAGGDWLRGEGMAAARLSVLVADAWRAEALIDEFEARGLTADTAEAPGNLIAVRSGVDPVLASAAARWTRGASLRVPSDLLLSASALRLWAVASGRRDDAGYLLRMAEPDDELHRAGGSQLSRLGVAAVDIGVRGGPGWRVTSARRLRRLAELVGHAPHGAGADWPHPE